MSYSDELTATFAHLELADTFEDWLAAPNDRLFATRDFCVWSISVSQTRPRFFGRAIWDVLSETSARLLDRYLAIITEPVVSILDARRLVDLQPAAFSVLGEGLSGRRVALEKCVLRAANVVAPTPVGAMIAGLDQLFGLRLHSACVADYASLARWLDYPECADFVASLDPALHALGDVPDMLSRLRVWLRANVAEATLATASRGLATSERSLQRHLASANVTFRDELTSARVAIAEKLLHDPNEKLGSIATAAGFTSLSHFTEMFKKARGMSPAEWRDRKKT